MLAVLTFFLNQTYYLRQIILSGLVTIWAIRLGGFLLVRIIAIGQDKRFDNMREKPLQFLRFWIFQFISIWVIYLPMCYVNAEYYDIALQWNDYFGWGLWLVGFLIETIADQQKFNYRQDPKNKDHWCDVGVWSWRYACNRQYWSVLTNSAVQPSPQLLWRDVVLDRHLGECGVHLGSR